ncbi:MAG: acyltransferase [Methylococcales bacterium]|nr:acyltransferase [Methylococcales bacterium]
MSLWRKLQANCHSIVQREHHYLPFIDGLRAIAVLLVFGFHVLFLSERLLGPKVYQGLLGSDHLLVNVFWQGDKGVDLFFVLSGFLIASILVREYQQTQSIKIRRYLTKRLARICPALYGLLLCAALLGLPNSAQAWRNILFINNYSGWDMLFAPWTWSVTVEVQFYLAVLLLLPLLYRWGRIPSSVMLLLLVLHVAYRARLIMGHDVLFQQPFAQVLADKTTRLLWLGDIYIDFFARIGPILVGVLLGCIYRYPPPGWLRFFANSGKRAVGIGGLGVLLALLVLSVPLYDPAGRYFSWVGSLGNGLLLSVHRLSFASAIGLIMVSQLFAPQGRDGLGRMLAARCWVPFARVSYSFYLYHIFALEFVYVHWPKHWGMSPWLNLALAGFLALLLALLMAVISYVLIEKNFIDWARMRSAKALSG